MGCLVFEIDEVFAVIHLYMLNVHVRTNIFKVKITAPAISTDDCFRKDVASQDIHQCSAVSVRYDLTKRLFSTTNNSTNDPSLSSKNASASVFVLNKQSLINFNNVTSASYCVLLCKAMNMAAMLLNLANQFEAVPL